MHSTHDDNRIPLPVGTIVEDNRKTKYTIESVAGYGGFAITYIAYDENSHRYVALKELYPKAANTVVAERDTGGKITIRNSVSPDDDSNEYWNVLLRSFRREAMLTRRASMLYNASGDIADQNHPDTLTVYGPFQDTGTGNHYLAFDTYGKETLDQLIRQGWYLSNAKAMSPNANLPEIIDVLKKVSIRLSNLHSDGQMFHLDLSPDNIYITRQLSGTAIQPYIIDYGSAYVRTNKSELTSHRFTKNDYSAPEIVSLSKLNDQNCGYRADASSDTYSICATLFYAVLGEKTNRNATEYADPIPSSNQEARIRAMYPSDIYENFAEQLIHFFGKGLAYEQCERYRTADDLYRALDELSKALCQKGLLAQMDPHTLAAYLALDRYPLYDYADENNNIHILCLGSGETADTMIRTMVWCGQMLNYTLNIHIVSPNAEQYRNSLLERAPELEKYSNLTPSKKTEVYVNFCFENLDVSCNEKRSKLLEQYGYCRYVIVALGGNKENAEFSHTLANDLAAKDLSKKYLIQYAQEDIAQNLRVDISSTFTSENITLCAFGNRLAENRHFSRKLGMQAFRLHYLYEKQGQPTISRHKSMDNFLRSKNAGYSQMSSAATALHMKYKLASIGIYVGAEDSVADSIHEYEQRVLGADSNLFNKLMYLEHRRWMMYVIVMEGFRCPTMEQVDKYCFRDGNYRFRDNSRKLHPCLVPCKNDGIHLAHRPRAEWDQYKNYDQIEASDFDELDKMSLKLHLLAKKKIADAMPNIHAATEMLQGLLRFFSDQDKYMDAQCALRQFKQHLDNAIEGEISTASIPYQELSACFEDVEVSIEGEIQQIKDCLRVVEEYYQYRDYKTPDQIIIKHLLWISFAVDHIELIKLKSKRPEENIYSALFLDPQKLIYLGHNCNDNKLRDFFLARGSDVDLSFVNCTKRENDDIKAELSEIVQNCVGICVIDITGSDKTLERAATELAAENKKIAIIYSDHEENQIREYANFPCALIYRTPQSLSVSDIYQLFGAEQHIQS